MRNMLAFLAALTLTLAGVGWYLGWYTIQRQPSASGKSTISIEFDENKAGADTKKFLQSVEKKIQKNDSTTKEPAPAAGTTNGKTDGAKVSKSTTSPDNPPKVILGVPPHVQ